MPKDNCEKRDSNDLWPAAKPKLIGWRTANFLWETDDIEKARNWEPYIGVLPIFEGDPYTKLYIAPVPAETIRADALEEGD